MSEVQREEGSPQVQEPPAPPTEAPPASDLAKPDDSQGGLKEVGLEELLGRAKMDAPPDAGGKQEKVESRHDPPKDESALDKGISILEKARQLLEQETKDAEEKKAAHEAAPNDAPQQDEAARDVSQEPEQDKAAPRIGDSPAAEKADESEKKDAEAKEEGKQAPAEIETLPAQEVPAKEAKPAEDAPK